MVQNDVQYKLFFENIKCNISSDSNIIIIDEFPIIEVQIKYIGVHKIFINWDDNFGYLLWEGKFVLVSKWNDGSYNTLELKFKTSNTYPPREKLELNEGDELKSILDFSKLPMSYEAKQIFPEGEIILVLCTNILDEKQELKPICNELMFTIN